ncbi:hypothetical protein K2173_016711 [Erythroxylum novogranatense]|uniref:Uncharacterized protein n=1 Tax=Erythroxylum novogranatense TaxID=1862640 RepID=A0AAV8SSY8_9ROSI|nr:hypothetical protein K2173_016711 [Erythroxylum novogranatense]
MDLDESHVPALPKTCWIKQVLGSIPFASGQELNSPRRLVKHSRAELLNEDKNQIKKSSGRCIHPTDTH